MKSPQIRPLGPLCGLASLALAASVSAAPLPSLELAARTVHAQAPGAVADASAFYLFTHRALTRDEVTNLEQLGLQYLGIAGPHVYAWSLHHAAAQVEVSLRARKETLGIAAVKPQDKLRSDLVAFLGRAGPDNALPFGLAITLWPGTPAGAARALVPEAAETARWPAGAHAEIGIEHAVYLGKAASTQDRLKHLLASTHVAAIGFDAPRTTFNEQSRIQSNSNLIFDAPYGLDGTGVVVGHWDGGEVDENHPDLAGRVVNLDNDEISSHATHTAGTILGSGLGDPDARGHAPGATLIARTYNGNAPAERRATKHTRYHQHDNHSWGQNPDTVSNFGTYNQTGYEFDVDARDLFLLAVKSAGNNGRESEVIIENTGFDSLSPDSTGKNTLVVGASNDRGALGVFSSRGPTEDGRLKPDLCAVGVAVRSTAPGGGYRTTQGTSMSAPGVSGMLALLSQLYTREYGRRWAPDLTRGIMIHTARDVWNRGPDFRYGWGLANAQAAADLILRDVEAEGRHLVRGAVREGEVAEWPMQVPQGLETLKVTMTWLDAFANAPAQRLLLHDLDLELVAPGGETFRPWTLDAANPLDLAVRDSGNTVDNVEQVLVDAPVAGTWTVRVAGTSVTDPQLSVQGFVVVADAPLERWVHRSIAEFGPTAPRTIPDGDEAGLSVPFEFADVGTVTSLRLHLEIEHNARGNLRIELAAPGGESVVLETEDTSERRDIYAIYPDTRSYDGDVAELFGKPSFGTWIVKITDTASGDIGSIRALALELDTNGQVNEPPVAALSADDPVVSEQTGTLYGATSVDPEARPLSFLWSQVEGPEVTLEGASTSTATYIAPTVEADTLLTFTLQVDDGRGATDTATISVTVLPPNRLPIAEAGPDLVVDPGQPIALDGRASSDPDGDTLSFSWVQLSGPSVVLDLPAESQTVGTAPDVAPQEALVFELTVNDGADASTDTVSVTVRAAAPNELETVNGCGCSTHGPTSSSPGLALLGLLGLLGLRRRR